MTEDNRQKLIYGLRRYSYKYSSEGFDLCSGGKSNILIDASETLRRQTYMHIVAGLIDEIVGYRVIDAIGGPGAGADPIAAAWSMYHQNMRWFSVRKEAKSRGLDKGLITGPVYDGDRVILVEDVMTTGSSLLRAIDACIENKLLIEHIIVIVDRVSNKNPKEVTSILGYPGTVLCGVYEIIGAK